jgi:PAS domain S-box-containing protein
MLKMVPARYDTAAAVVSLADDLANLSVSSQPAEAIDRFRRRLEASDVVVWLCQGGRVSRAIQVGDHVTSDDSAVNLAGGTVVIERLLHSGTVLCRFGDVSGLEPLIPPSVRSFAAAAATRREALTAILIVGWTQVTPPCDSGNDLRVAAGLIARTIADGWLDHRSDMADVILGSISERLAVVDAQGVIVSVNPAWTESARQNGVRSAEAVGAGVSYLEVCRRALANGCADARAVIDGLTAVSTGNARIFQATYANDAPLRKRWGLVTITPLRRPGGGAVLSHSDLAHAEVVEMARRLGEARFRSIAESVPVPLWMVAPDGQVLFGNERWIEQAGGITRGGSWLDACHPDDRSGADQAFQDSVARAARFQVEVRLKAADGVYRWHVCSAMPRFTGDGRVDHYVGVCWDASAKRRAESAFNRVAGKLVSAQETERSRIARELHDDLGQQIAVLASKLDVAANTRGRAAFVRRAVLDSLVNLREIASSLHAMSHQLHPGKLRLLGLVTTLEALCRDEASGTGVTVRFTSRHVPRDVDDDTALTLFRVAQESLRNALKHSGASTIAVSVTANLHRIALRVSDNGNGFNPMTSSSTGLGLLTMRERAELAGGALSVVPARPHGTTVRIVVPLRRAVEISVAPLPSGDDAPPPAPAAAAATSPAFADRGPESIG